jgi:hypothetical protein
VCQKVPGIKHSTGEEDSAQYVLPLRTFQLPEMPELSSEDHTTFSGPCRKRVISPLFLCLSRARLDKMAPKKAIFAPVVPTAPLVLLSHRGSALPAKRFHPSSIIQIPGLFVPSLSWQIIGLFVFKKKRRPKTPLAHTRIGTAAENAGSDCIAATSSPPIAPSLPTILVLTDR